MGERLRSAVEAGRLDEVEALVRGGVDVNAPRDGATALSVAISAEAGPDESLRRVSCLLRLGARVSAEHGRGFGTSVHHAARFGYGAVLERLLSADGEAALNTFDDAEQTPLMYAVQNRDLALAKLLLDAGSDVNARDAERNGDPALVLVFRRRGLSDLDVAMVRLLVSNGANPSLAGWMEMTAADHLQARCQEGLTAPLERIASLFRKGGDPPHSG